MSRLISRILLAVLLIPAAALVDLTSFILLERRPWPSERSTLIANLLTCAFIDVYWFVLWRTSLKWTKRRRRITLWALGLSFLVGSMIGWVVNYVVDNVEVSMFIGLMSAATLWLIATVFVWRETPAERSERLRRAGADTLVCPACGYNLTGLREARCPECGARLTLNELLSAPP